MRKICVITGTRAEYGLLFWLIKKISNTKGLELQIIVTGSHLSKDFGLTLIEIEKDFKINKKIEILQLADSTVGISKSMSLALESFAEAYQELEPDLLVVLGDRYEIFSAVSAATVSRIPIAHLHGGETTEGAFDESFRHSITKMSHLHFTAHEQYRNRVIQLGENPKTVFNVGSIGVDGISKLNLLTRDSFEESINCNLSKKNLLITFHPATLDNSSAYSQFSTLLGVLDTLEDTLLIFTKSNADTDGDKINELIVKYVKNNSNKAIAFASLGQLRYLSAMKYIDGLVGNSSSGLIEAPSFKVGSINIGDRQKGRLKAKSVIDCEPTDAGIRKAIKKLYSKSFKKQLQSSINPYEGIDVAEKIVDIIKSYNLDNILKKSFYDLNLSKKIK